MDQGVLLITQVIPSFMRPGPQVPYAGKVYRTVRVCTSYLLFGPSTTWQNMTCYKYSTWCVPATGRVVGLQRG